MSGGSGQGQSQVPTDTQGSYNHCPPRSVEKDGHTDYLPPCPMQGTGPDPLPGTGEGSGDGKAAKRQGADGSREESTLCLGSAGFQDREPNARTAQSTRWVFLIYVTPPLTRAHAISSRNEAPTGRSPSCMALSPPRLPGPCFPFPDSMTGDNSLLFGMAILVPCGTKPV